jgi:hypothetical protein
MFEIFAVKTNSSYIWFQIIPFHVVASKLVVHLGHLTFSFLPTGKRKEVLQLIQLIIVLFATLLFRLFQEILLVEFALADLVLSSSILFQDIVFLGCCFSIIILSVGK